MGNYFYVNSSKTFAVGVRLQVHVNFLVIQTVYFFKIFSLLSIYHVDYWLVLLLSTYRKGLCFIILKYSNNNNIIYYVDMSLK